MAKVANRNTFNAQLKKVIEQYGFNITDFKRDHNENSNYYYPLEIAQLLALLIKIMPAYPLYKEDSLVEAKGTEIQSFNELLHNEIEEGLSEVFQQMIYVLPSYIESLKIRDFTKELVDQLTVFIINVTKSQHNGVGSTIKWLCERLDEANYSLFEGNQILSKVYESNEIFKRNLIEEIGDLDEIEAESSSELNSIFKALNQQGIALEQSIGLLIKRLLQDTKHLNYAEKGTPAFDYTKLSKEEKYFLGIDIIADNSEHHFIERELYENLLFKRIDKTRLDEVEFLLEDYGKYVKRFNDRKEKLKAGSEYYRKKVSLSQKKKMIENEIALLEQQLKELNAIEDESELYKDDFVIQLSKEYIEFYDNCLKEQKNDLREIVDDFIGRTLINLHHFNKPKI